MLSGLDSAGKGWFIRNMKWNFNCLKPKHIWIYKNLVFTAKKTQHITIAKINCLILFREIIALYTDIETQCINTECRVSDC
jgi:hypothetical protein